MSIGLFLVVLLDEVALPARTRTTTRTSGSEPIIWMLKVR
jgi:hypothetical protein